MTLTTYLIVRDMTASLAFYRAFFQKKPGGGCPERFAVFDVGSTNLALFNPLYDEELIESGADLSQHFNAAYLAGKDIPTTYGNNAVINIGVKDLSVEYARVRELNIGMVSDIMYVNIAMPYYFFTLTDPDGNCIEITGGYKP